MPALYVVRHAEPALTGVLLGQADPPLSDAGMREAARLREIIPVCTVYTSPLRRAIQTAYFIHAAPEIVAEFTEISYGDWDGFSWSEIERIWPEIAKTKLADWTGVISPNGEEWSSFRARVTAGLKRVTKGTLPATIVAHEAVNGVIAEEFTSSAIQSYQQKYCEIIQYDIRSGT